jgi:PadR family transcriptional regulator
VALSHLRASLTKENLWLYILSVLASCPASPAQIKRKVAAAYGFAPASITFYTVVYRLRKEGLVRRTSEEYRSMYELTDTGAEALQAARSLLVEVAGGLALAGRDAEAR